MLLDIRTVIFCTFTLDIFLALLLYFYARNQKTYEGFGLWIVAILITAAGNLFLGARGFMPEAVSILLANLSISLSCIVGLDSVWRFVRGKALNRKVYALPVVLVVFVSVFTFVQDSIAIRNLGLSIFLTIACLFYALTFFRHSGSESRAIYWMMGSLFVLFCMELLVRAVVWTVKPDLGLFDSTAPALIHFFAVIVFEVGWALGFVMINAQRVENELRTLSGLLPICASCKKIRDDKGYWNQLEDYIGRHSKAEFSHGICPTCAEELYPEIFLKAV